MDKTLSKGTQGGKGSIDTQFTYPLAKLINSRWGGYLTASLAVMASIFSTTTSIAGLRESAIASRADREFA